MIGSWVSAHPDVFSLWLPVGIPAFFGLLTLWLRRKPKTRKEKAKDPLLSHVDEDGVEWRRTLGVPPPWRK